MKDRWYRNDIELTEDHRKLAARLNVVWYPDMEWGAVEFGDAKRPFGNNDMPSDVATILGWDFDEEEGPNEEQRARAMQLHFEMGYVAKSLLAAWAMTMTGD